MIDENREVKKYIKTDGPKRKCCVIIVNEDKILLKKMLKNGSDCVYEFPKRDFLSEDDEVSKVFSKMKEKYGIKAKTKDRFICNIQHSYKNFDLKMYVFEIQAPINELDFSEELKNTEWFSIDQIWNVPLAPPDVTLAQLLLESNE